MSGMSVITSVTTVTKFSKFTAHIYYKVNPKVLSKSFVEPWIHEKLSIYINIIIKNWLVLRNYPRPLITDYQIVKKYWHINFTSRIVITFTKT